MSRPIQIVTRTAETDCAQYLIAAMGSGLGKIVLADGDNTPIGAIVQPGDCKTGDRVDVMEAGIGELRLGGSVAPGDTLVSDANGQAVTGTSGKAIGIALDSGVMGDIIDVRIAPQLLAAAAE